MNEADEVKEERSGFVGDEGGLGDAVRVARRAVKLCEEWPYSLYCSLRLSAFFSYDVGSCLHTAYIIRVVKCLNVVWLSLLIALGWPHLHVPVPIVRTHFCR